MRNDRVVRRAALVALGLLALGTLSGCPDCGGDGDGKKKDRSGRCGLCLDACEAHPETRAACMADCRNGACRGQ